MCGNRVRCGPSRLLTDVGDASCRAVRLSSAPRRGIRIVATPSRHASIPMHRLRTTLLVALVLASPGVRPLAAQPAVQHAVSLTLGGAARLAADRGAGPETARLRALQADARVRQRRAELLPSITASAFDGERTFNSAGLGIAFADPATGRGLLDPNGQRLGPVRSWDLRGSVRQNLFDGAALARLRAARSAALAGAEDATGASQQAAAAAATAYVRAIRADAHLGARQTDSVLAAELVGMARDQLNAGIGIALDVTRARAQLSLIRSQLIAARSERERARIDLVRTLGLADGTPVTLVDSLPSIGAASGPASANDAVARALRARGDVRAAIEQSAAAERLVAAIRAERLPSLSLFADQGSNGKATDRLLNTYSWGIQLSVPVFDGFRREGRLDEQRAASRELDVRRREIERQVTADIRVALLDLGAARELLEAADERLSLAEQELDQARERLRAGVAGNAEVITASLALNSARTQAIEARAGLLFARVALGRAQGSVSELP